MDGTINLPLRTRLYDMSDGTQQIHIIINGRVSSVLQVDHDARNVKEIPLPTDMHPAHAAIEKETKPYTRKHPILDNTNRLGQSHDDETRELPPKETK